ncbi:Proteasome assembly chaperone 2 [Mortierella hygrophila]|uniref:Proteasome assembly chaperone 2 n=1 Tax=Mortierella hygrophila TaxID=979708 RepID=A0A9P6EXR3_9FUNG|nr:Proteasome assembly chaperone 2 [Mortierella hygrophila]
MNSFVPSPGFDARRFKGTTLILPSVSIGNVPQLTTDLLLSTLKLDRVGCIEDENVVPVLGPADRPQSESTSATASGTGAGTGVVPGGLLSLAVEVFQSKDGKWTLIQQRSPTVSHRSHHYADNLVRFIQDSEFDQVVLLASADGARRIDIQLRSGNPVRYIPSPQLPGTVLETLRGLGLEELENIPATDREVERARELHVQLAEQVQDIQLDEPSTTLSTTTSTQRTLEKVPRIPNGGFARRLHSLCQESGIAILTVVAFAMEGDNAPDAIFLANVLNAILRVHSPTEQQVRDGEGEWKVPKSWDSLYGNSHHQDMYQ